MKNLIWAFIFTTSVYGIGLGAEGPGVSKMKQDMIAKAIDIDAITYRIFDRQTGTWVPLNGFPSDPYGIHADVFVEIKIKSTNPADSAGKAFTVELRTATKEGFDQARGAQAAKSKVYTREKIYLTEPGHLTTIPFLIPYECDALTMTAEIPALKISRKIEANFSCAE